MRKCLCLCFFGEKKTKAVIKKEVELVMGKNVLPEEMIFCIGKFLRHKDIKAFFQTNTQFYKALNKMPLKYNDEIIFFSQLSRQLHKEYELMQKQLAEEYELMRDAHELMQIQILQYFLPIGGI
jgi:hypothetical protein